LTTSQRIKAAMLDYSLEIAWVETPTVVDALRLESRLLMLYSFDRSPRANSTSSASSRQTTR
jgi:hypothetical protein